MPQETLSEMIGTTRSRVNSFMKKFRKLGFIHYTNRKIHIDNALLSVVLHDQLTLTRLSEVPPEPVQDC
jgi:TATA-box binding protein (TBP) (component of TFIID and TFIIIB)